MQQHRKLKYGTKFKFREDAEREVYYQEQTNDYPYKYEIKVVAKGDYIGWFYLRITN